MEQLRSQILGLLPAYGGKKILLKDEQDTGDIIDEITRTHKKCVLDYDKISSLFWKGDVKKTAQFIWDFLKQNVKYSIEPGSHQSVKTPAAIVATGIFKRAGNDCKHYSLFAAGILDSLKRHGYPVNWNYRFANYRLMKKNPQHVFVVARDKSGSDFWIDPVLPSFNNRKPFVNAIDKNINTMALYEISGVPDNMNGFFDFLKPIGKALLAPVKLLVKGVTIIGLLPSRQAFLECIRLNLGSLATNLNAAIKDPEKKKKIGDIWAKFGGSKDTLFNTIIGQNKLHYVLKPGENITAFKASQIQQGMNKDLQAKIKTETIQEVKKLNEQRIQTTGKKMSALEAMQLARQMKLDKQSKIGFVKDGDNGIGTFVAVLAAAAPIIAAVAQFFPKTTNIVQTSQDAIRDISAAGGINEPGFQIPAADGTLPRQTNLLATELNAGAAVEDAGGGIKQYIPYVLIGGGALYLLTRKN